MSAKHDPELTRQIRQLALEAGFARVGVAPAEPPESADKLRQWLGRGWHGDMDWLAGNLEVRIDPGRLIEGAQSVICMAVGYSPADENAGQKHIARFARGRDYHKILGRRCRNLCDRIRLIAPDFVGRSFVDSGPLMERSLAVRAGLGWIGRNGCLICPGLGSYVLLCEIVCNLPLVPDSRHADDCGRCARCIEACPTAAIGDDSTIDARRCISHLSQRDGDISAELMELMGCRIFGCDACQEACPHNGKIPPGDAELIQPHAMATAKLGELLELDEEKWSQITTGSVIRRTGLKNLLRNAMIAAANSGRADLLPKIEELSRNNPELADLAEWSKSRMAGPHR